MTDNEEYIIDIKSIASDGCGVGHIDGLTVFEICAVYRAGRYG